MRRSSSGFFLQQHLESSVVPVFDLVVGPVGQGKSTTLASMIEMVNNSRSEHIITIEDPIEFVHTSKNTLIEQREV